MNLKYSKAFLIKHIDINAIPFWEDRLSETIASLNKHIEWYNSLGLFQRLMFKVDASVFNADKHDIITNIDFCKRMRIRLQNEGLTEVELSNHEAELLNL